jgi:hypothetical protein
VAGWVLLQSLGPAGEAAAFHQDTIDVLAVIEQAEVLPWEVTLYHKVLSVNKFIGW